MHFVSTYCYEAGYTSPRKTLGGKPLGNPSKLQAYGSKLHTQYMVLSLIAYPPPVGVALKRLLRAGFDPGTAGGLWASEEYKREALNDREAVPIQRRHSHAPPMREGTFAIV